MESVQYLAYLLAKKFSRTVANNQSVGLVIRYLGSQPSATIQVSSTNILFKTGVLGSEAADANVQIGATPGTIDLTQTTANNFGKVLDYLNGVTDSTGAKQYEAYLGDVLRGDATAPSGSPALTAVAATQANRTIVPAGVAFTLITANVLYVSKKITARYFPIGFNNSIAKVIAELSSMVSNNTYGSGTSTVQVWELNPLLKTETLVYSRAGGLTTVDQAIDSASLGIQSDVGNELLVRFVGSAAASGFLTTVGKLINL